MSQKLWVFCYNCVKKIQLYQKSLLDEFIPYVLYIIPYPVTMYFSFLFFTIIFTTVPFFRVSWWCITIDVVLNCLHIIVLDKFLLLFIVSVVKFLIKRVYMHYFSIYVFIHEYFLLGFSMVYSKWTVLLMYIRSIILIVSIHFFLRFDCSYVSLIFNIPFSDIYPSTILMNKYLKMVY